MKPRADEEIPNFARALLLIDRTLDVVPINRNERATLYLEGVFKWSNFFSLGYFESITLRKSSRGEKSTSTSN